MGFFGRVRVPDDRRARLAGLYGARNASVKAKTYKHKKRGAGRHVQLPEYLQASAAWATMKPGPRALYIELKRRFNGSNNGQIFLSHRNAGKALNVHHNTAGPWFHELQKRGFIHMTCGPHLGPSGIGQASVWALDEEPTADMKPARMGFMRWPEKQNPSTKIVPPRHKKQDTSNHQTAKSAQTVTKKVTHLANSGKPASQKTGHI